LGEVAAVQASVEVDGWATGYRRPWGPYGWPQVMDTETELAQLKQEADDLKAYIKDVEGRIAEIEKTSE